MNDQPTRAELPDHERRMAAARRAAQWYLGDRGWADKIVGYYLNPADSLSVLERRQREMQKT